MEKYNFALALTGGIATGKSTICKYLKKDFKIIDADLISHEILDKNVDFIQKTFGEKCIKNDIVDRKILGEIIFNHDEKKKALEGFLHPLIRDEIFRQIKMLECKKSPFFVDIPLYFETKAYHLKYIILVYCDKKTQLKRLIKRNNLSKNEALQRINSQINIEEKRKNSHFIIDNSKDINHLLNEFDKFKIWLKEKYADIKI